MAAAAEQSPRARLPSRPPGSAFKQHRVHMAPSAFHLAFSVQRLMAPTLDKQGAANTWEPVQSVLKVMTERRGAHSEGPMASAHTQHNLDPAVWGRSRGKDVWLAPPSSSEDTPGSVLYVAQTEQPPPAQGHMNQQHVGTLLSASQAGCVSTAKAPSVSSVRTRLQRQGHASRHISQQDVLRAR